MNQSEKRLYLINELLNESSYKGQIKIPKDTEGQRTLLRSLFNIRDPKPISKAFLKIQDEYLKERNRERGIVPLSSIEEISNDIFLWQGDITLLDADAIVNAANSALLGCFRPMHSCIDNCIHTYSGIELRLACNEIMQKQGHEEETGKAKITPAFNLPSKFVIHTVGPIVYEELTPEHEDLLVSSYENCLKLADENDCKSIAFPCISTGVFMFPNERAAELAVQTVFNYKKQTNSKIKVIFNVFKDLDLEIYESILSEVNYD